MSSKFGLKGKNLNLLATRMYTFIYWKPIWPVSWHFGFFKICDIWFHLLWDGCNRHGPSKSNVKRLFKSKNECAFVNKKKCSEFFQLWKTKSSRIKGIPEKKLYKEVSVSKSPSLGANLVEVSDNSRKPLRTQYFLEICQKIRFYE